MSEHPEFPAEKMADMLEVSRSGFYKYREACSCGTKAAQIERVATFDKLVRLEYEGSRRRSGSPKIRKVLFEQGIRSSRKRVAASMHRQGLRSIYRKKYRPCTTDSQHSQPIASNLLNRNFSPAAPNTSWVTDITYIPTMRGWVYLVVFIDLFSRKVVSWNIDDHMETSMVRVALQRALWTRKPSKGLLIHSDRGKQYASVPYVKELTAAHCIQSMSRKGNCWDNAVAESFFGCLKAECVGKRIFENIDKARAEIFEYIEVFYNRKRLHSTIGYKSPDQFESEKLKRVA
jgi:putative transposase